MSIIGLLFVLFLKLLLVTGQLVPPTIEEQYEAYFLAGRAVSNLNFPKLVSTEFYSHLGVTGLLIIILPSPLNTTILTPTLRPLSVTFPLPYCRTGPPVVLSEAPATCSGGTLSYGQNSIPTLSASIPDSQNVVVNGPDANGLISGLFYTALDSGGGYVGTITYVPPPACPLIGNSDFQVSIFIPGIQDVGDTVPIGYVSQGLKTPTSPLFTEVSLTTFGGGCTTIARPTPTILYNASPVILPVCRASTPANFPALAPSWYSQMFGTPSPQTPINLNAMATVYQLRVENLTPNITIDFLIRTVYLDNSTDITAASTDFSNVLYYASSGRTPAFIFACFYNFNKCQPLQIYKESDLFELETCMCSHNLYCNTPTSSVVPLLTPVPRANLPYFNSPLGFVNPPVCAFLVNPEGNFSNPVMGQTISATSVSQGGVAPLQFNWQLSNVPPSVAVIVTPTTIGTIGIFFSASGTYTLQLVVTGADGYRAPCSQSITVTQGLPILCVAPSPATGSSYSIAVGQTFEIDATCSKNPYGTPMSFGWTTYNYNSSMLPFTLSDTSDPIITLTGLFPGLAVLFLNVTNQAVVAGVLSGSAWQAFYVTVYSISPVPLPPGVSPFFNPLAPTCSFFPPAAPTPGIPFPPPTFQPPIGTMPASPGSPNSVNPAGTTPFGGFFGPDAEIPLYFIPLLSFLFIAILLAAIGFFLYRYIKRRRRLETGYVLTSSGANRRRTTTWFGANNNNANNNNDDEL